MGKTLSRKQIEQYNREGFVFPIDVMTEDETRLFREKLESTQAEGKLTGSGQTKFYLRFPWVHRLATSPSILNPVEDILGPNLMLYHNTMWSKDGGDGAYVSWHQDNTYFGHNPCEVLTVWIALSETTLENGCMQFLPGSHKLGELPLDKPDIQAGNLLSSGQTVNFDISAIDPVPVRLKPGQASIHHAHLIHSSAPNKTQGRRLGMTFIYHPTSLKQAGNVRTSALLVRGEDKFNNFDPEIPPGPVEDPETMERYRHAVGLYRAKVKELGNKTVGRFDGNIP
jgi:non-heme Fe2+,alpha-ketoglutarate-dependent halogenase